MVKVELTDFMGWKDCIKISAAGAEIIALTKVGPRIISYTMAGGKNHMVVFPETAGSTKKSESFVPYGGHRLWHAPETAPRTYQSDSFPCEYELYEDGAAIISAPETATHTRRGMDIRMTADGTTTVTHFIKNEGLFDVELSLWALSQFDIGGVLAVPHSTLDTGYVANRVVSMWPYSKMNDSRVFWGGEVIAVQATDDTVTPPFKFGTSLDGGWSAYFNHNQLIVKQFDYYYNAEYPNYYCNFESYTNGVFIEMESLSPLITIEPGEMETWTEKWSIFDNVKCPALTDEKAIVAAVNEKIGK